MKLSKSRSCVTRNSLPAAQKSRKKTKVPWKIPSLPLQVHNIQRRRYDSTMEVKIDNCITARDLKDAIEVQKNLAVIALLYRGVPVDDTYQLEKLLPDLEVGPIRFAVHTRIRPRAIVGGVTINVLTLIRKTFQVSLHSLDTTLLELKEIIKSYEGMSVDQIALTYQGKQITVEDHSTLRTCNLEPGCTVTLVGRLRGGGVPLPLPGQPREFVDMGEKSLLQKFRLEPKRAPEWRVSEEGPSVEGKCPNEYCIAYNQMVICNLKFRVMNFLMEEFVCPVCMEPFIPVTCGFRRCLWMFEGRKNGECSLYVNCKWMEAGNRYERFDESAELSTATWSSLIITAKQLPSQKNMKAYTGDGGCPICWGTFTASSLQCSLKCEHAFHRECLISWQKQGHSTCPMCRESME